MKLRLFHLAFLFALAVHGPAQADDTGSQTGPLGKVSFPTSCDPKVQPAFERAVAMLHSFWYSAGEKAFRDVLKDDPQCAIATWGIASILMSNPLGGQGASPKGAEQAQAADAAAPASGSEDGISSPESLGVSSATLDAIASCESGGDPTAVSADGTYRGKYQFDYGTWASVGGHGDPAAAPEKEQDYRAALLYSRGGSSPWPICG